MYSLPISCLLTDDDVWPKESSRLHTYVCTYVGISNTDLRHLFVIRYSGGESLSLDLIKLTLHGHRGDYE